jgi:uncharacterized protein (UPF0332 family)
MNNKEDSIKHKMEKAIALMNEVDTLIANAFYTTAVSRLYYSCFHVTKALLLTKDLIPKTHRGVDVLLHEHFVKVKEFDPVQASFFGKLMQEELMMIIVIIWLQRLMKLLLISNLQNLI